MINQYIPPYQTGPCPSCGHCPTCGRGGYHTYPYPWYPYIQSGTTAIQENQLTAERMIELKEKFGKTFGPKNG